MKKRSMTFIGALSLMFITVVGCKKEENTVTNQSSKQSVFNTKSSYTNPYNFVGIGHNDALIGALTKSGYRSLTSSSQISYIKGLVETSFTNNGASAYTGKDISSTITSTVRDEVTSSSFDPETYYTSKLSRLNSSEQAAMQDMVDLFDLYVENGDWSSFRTSMNALEQSVGTSTSLDNNTKARILSAYALGKASFSFWTNHESTPAPSQFKIKPWLADVGGFITGAWGSWQQNGDINEAIETGTVLGGFASEVAALVK
jgi:hypothetical protein